MKLWNHIPYCIFLSWLLVLTEYISAGTDSLYFWGLLFGPMHLASLSDDNWEDGQDGAGNILARYGTLAMMLFIYQDLPPCTFLCWY